MISISLNRNEISRLEHRFSDIIRKLDDANPVWDQLVPYYESLQDEWFDAAGMGWKPVTEDYIAWAGGPSPILQRTGGLKRSFGEIARSNHHLVVGSDHRLARTHNDGYHVRRAYGSGPPTNVPARPVSFWSNRGWRERFRITAVRTAQRWVDAIVAGGNLPRGPVSRGRRK